MINEKGVMNFRQLSFFYTNNIKIHFKDLDNIFYNGRIIDLNEDKLTLVLDERVKGIIPVLLENIKTDSIEQFKENPQ